MRKVNETAYAEAVCRGFEVGFKVGLEQGRLEGHREFVAWLLRERFGALPEDVVDRIAAAPHDELDAWRFRALRAPSLADLLDG